MGIHATNYNFFTWQIGCDFSHPGYATSLAVNKPPDFQRWC